MKKKLLFLSILSFIVFNLVGNNIDQRTATIVANNYFNYISNGQVNDLKLSYTKNMDNGSPLYFAFNNANDRGFILIAGDNAAVPILAYALNGNINLENLHSSIESWLQGYILELEYIKKNNVVPSQTISKMWNDYVQNKFATNTNRVKVAPLCAAIWNQSPYFNDACPYDSAVNVNCVAGCPATAMATILKYHKHPAQGAGSTSYKHPKYESQASNFSNYKYKWDLMPDTLTGKNDEIARLIYHIGVAVEMQYSAKSSGSYMIESKKTPKNNCQYAYKNYFGYDETTLQGLRRSAYEDTAWIKLLKLELDEKRPIQYAGFGGGGHTFVCDGYDVNDMFHMNWGWGGAHDGYFTLNSLNPGTGGIGSGEGHFNNYQQAIIGIMPKANLLSSAPIFGMRLDTSITISPMTITDNSAVTITTKVKFGGIDSLKTDLAAILFTKEGDLIDYIQIHEGQVFKPGISTAIIFTTNSIDALQGNYEVGIYSSQASDSSWYLIDPSNFTNPVPLKVTGIPLSLKLANNIGKPSSTVIVKNDFTFKADIKNDSTEEFSGEVVLKLYDFDGELVETINSTQPVVIPAGATANGIEFKKTNNTLDPGTYIAGIFISHDMSSYDMLSNDKYDNPVELQIIEEPLLADKYEQNNTSAEAFVVPLNFVNDLAVTNTSESNLHNETDYDYYKLNLSAGYKYVIQAEVHDEVFSPLGIAYNCDVYFSYDLGSGESDFYDDTLTQNIILNNGGNVTFKVSPFFVGFNGSYLLNWKISRTKVNAIAKMSSENMVELFPNPTSDHLFIKVKDKNISISELVVKNQLGELITVKHVNDIAEDVTLLNTTHLPNGIYFLQINNKDKTVINKKFIVNR